ncbi:MAG: molybdenum ABC transporter ATP-binding protein [Aestuariivirgaceae bacterium]
MNDIAVDVAAVRGSFTLDVETVFNRSGVTVVLGPSGAGKTTLLRAIAGLEQDARGQVRIGSHYWLDSRRGVFLPPHKRAVGYVFQEGRLFPHLTVEGNLNYAERRAREEGPRFERRQILDVLAIEKLLDRPSATLSGGEIQRVAVARALLSRPQLLLMDEPLSALDIARRAEALAYIERVPEEFGIPIIYVTHAIEEAARLAKELAVMVEGRIIASGPAQAILARLDLALYLGHFEAGAIIEGVVGREDRAYGLTTVDIGAGTLEVPIVGLPMGRRLRLRIRARDVALATARPEGLSIRNIIPVTVEEIAEEKGSAFAELRLLTGQQVLRARITQRSVEDLGLRRGSPAYALIKSIAVDRQLIAGRTQKDE